MKSTISLILSLSFYSLAAQVQPIGSAVQMEVQNRSSLTTSIVVPSSAFATNLIAVAITEFQHNFPAIVVDKESGKEFTLAKSLVTRNGSLLALYFLVNAANGQHTIEVSTGAGNNTNMKTITTAYTGVDHLSPLAFTNSNSNTVVNNLPALNISCYADQVVVHAMVFEGMVAEGSTSTSTTSTTSTKNAWNLESASKTSTASGGLNLTWDYASSPRGFWGSIAFTLQPTNYAIIPGQLFNFYGKLNNNRVELSWITTFETNVKYICVMKSADNKEWKEIVRMAGAGYSSVQKQYSAEDRNLEPGNFFYKLVFISGDGKKSSSSIVSVKSASDKKLKFGNMQNPINSSLQVNLYTATDKKVLVTMFNSRGVAITSHYVIPQNGAVNFVMEQAKNLSPGVYFLQCTSENETISKSIVKH